MEGEVRRMEVDKPGNWECYLGGAIQLETLQGISGRVRVLNRGL